jgi:hypothetical protein
MFWLMSSMALAGSVYVNGVNVDALRNQTFEDVTVTIDAAGNVQIQAPQYQIEVVDGAPAGPPPVAAAPPPVAARPPVAAQPPVAAANVPPPVRPVAPVQAGVATGVPAGIYWLVTEDAGSRGHTVDVHVNGVHVHTAKSGEAQQIIDLARHLRPGDNQVKIESNSQGAGGGPLYVYLGTGDNRSGTVVLDTPEIQYGLGASRRGAQSREYVLTTR